MKLRIAVSHLDCRLSFNIEVRSSMAEPWRSIVRVVEAQETSDGAGVRLKRTLGTPALDYLDPFLLLDEFKSDNRADYIAGFPDHPHRGFETVTYMLAGSMEHRDHKGNCGQLIGGSVQWMTAGRGIIHSEMPRQKDGLLWGFQLWVNLPAREKMCEPRYQDLSPEKIPEVQESDGTRVRVIAGRTGGLSGAVTGIVTDPLYLDVKLPARSRFEQSIRRGHHGFCYVFEGQADFGCGTSEASRSLGPSHFGVLSDGDAVRVVTESSPVRFLLLAARPLHEPMARYGPFVMNTREELHQAFRDYQQGTFLN